MGTTLRQRYAMVDFFRFYQLSSFLTQLAQRMFVDIAVTDTLPGTAISAADSRISIILFITLRFLLCVFFAEPTLCQSGATRM